MVKSVLRGYWWLLFPVLIGLLVGASGPISPVVRAQELPPTPTATLVPIALFHDDFITRANRWTLSAAGDQDTISYSEPDSTLVFDLTTPHGVVSSIPDTDLTPDTFTLDLHADWHGISPDVRVGAILAEYGDNDFIAVTVTHGGLVQISAYQQDTWQDLTPPQQTTLRDLSALSLHVEVNAVDSATLDRQVSVTLNNVLVLTATIPDYRPGAFGIVAENGASGKSSFSVHDFRVSQISQTSKVLSP